MRNEPGILTTTRGVAMSLLAAAALAAGPVPVAFGDERHGTATTGQSAAQPGMSADEHAAHGGSSAETPASATGAQDSGEHAAGAQGAGGHGEASLTDRPAGLLLGGFGLLNGAVLLYATVIRRRPDAVKRRQTLARVRGTVPVRTVMSAPNTRERP
jgi:hypothetical protein